MNSSKKISGILFSIITVVIINWKIYKNGYENLPERNIVMLYIITVKMLDAAYLIIQRRREKKTADTDTHSE